jgi:uncharacterized protein (TIGR02996 family)
MSAAIEILLEALHADCSDETAWLAVADALEESGQSARAELTRLLRRRCDQTEARVQELLQGGVLPCVPERTNSIGMRFVLIPSGTFRMGSPDDEEGRSDAEGPVHEVEITKAFYLGAHPVTQAQYWQVTGSNHSRFRAEGGEKDAVKGMDTDDFPVENVTWEDAVAFCQKLTAVASEKHAGRKYRLPSEAEWEHGCRGGASSYQVFHFGNSLSSKQANFNGRWPYGGADEGPWLDRTCKVGSYAPNAFGLYDMHGNVWEWCSDWYGADYYSKSSRRDPQGPSEGSDRVGRGGGYGAGGRNCRSAKRIYFTLADHGGGLGFRAALFPADA